MARIKQRYFMAPRVKHLRLPGVLVRGCGCAHLSLSEWGTLLLRLRLSVVKRRGWTWAPIYYVREYLSQAVMMWSDTKRQQEKGRANTTCLGGSALFGNASEWVHVGPSQKRCGGIQAELEFPRSWAELCLSSGYDMTTPG